MVYTRQMTIGNNGNNECTEHNSTDNGPARSTRNSLAIASSSQGQCNKCNPIQPTTTTPPPPPPQQPGKQINLLDLPQEIIEKIFGYLTYKNICQLRFVCTRIDHICGHILNTTFQRLQHHLLERFHEIKRKMPRRESARRNHHLACESDIIETLHMRLTLLQMSLGKHIERKHCCFFPGEILDEVLHILHYIKVTPKLARPYKVTDELFDLSTMAMEYFKEKIEPDLPEIAYFSTDFLDIGNFPSTSTNKYLCLDSYSMDEEAKDNENQVHESNGENSTETTPQSNIVLRKGIKKIKQGMKKYNSQLSILRQDVRSCRQKATEQQKLMSEQQKQLGEQQKQILEYATRMDENEKKNDEISRKFSTLLQELNKCKTELQYWRSKSPATPPFCTNCGNAILPNTDDIESSLINNNNNNNNHQDINNDNNNIETEFEPIDETKNDTEQDEQQQQSEVTINPTLSSPPSSSSSSTITTIKTTPIRTNPITTTTTTNTCENSDQKDDNKSNNLIKKRKLDETIDTPVIRNVSNKKSRRILKGRNYQKSKV